MFNLEGNIHSWSENLRANGKLEEEDILKLEKDLREQVNQLKEKGLSEDEAFLIGVKRLGNNELLKEEYSKDKAEDLWKHLLRDKKSKDASDKKKHKPYDILLVVILILLAGTAAKLPTLPVLGIKDNVYFKNLSFYILPFIVIFFAIKSGVEKKLLGWVLGIFLATAVIVNLYPSYNPNHTQALTGMHLPIMLWLVTGVAYMGNKWRANKERMDFIRLTGECVIYGSLIMLGVAVLLMFINIIFEAISVNVGQFIGDYLIFYCFCGAAIVSVYLVYTKKKTIENFAPILAKIFSPLFLITMIIFLIVMGFTGNSPFVNRDFLITFDFMLVLVLGMVLYIISARKNEEKSNIFDYINVALIITALIIDGIALSAIVIRLAEYGVTPNKMAALGENILLLVNLVGLLWLYIKYFMKKLKFIKIEIWQTTYLTVYAIWMAVVVFVFPVVFGFK